MNENGEGQPGTGGGVPASGGERSTGGQPSGAGGDPFSGAGGFHDIQCPDEPPEETIRECDPFDPYADCDEGQGCYSFATFVAKGPCGSTVYGSYCMEVGPGTQGDLCGAGGERCAPGFMCVVGGGGGARCARVCNILGGAECPNGLICGETDVQNIGVCY